MISFVPGLIVGAFLAVLASAAALKIRQSYRNARRKLRRATRTRIGLVEATPRGRGRARARRRSRR
ncbi:hypothetical protein ACFQZ2_08510 [Streptomonospora algeriensis]|uniref:Uncharacterized protein n=1 Tax=Streptomonospora algeriensis TaxID=995084 RepID=A0ABW3BFL6_9ACTN